MKWTFVIQQKLKVSLLLGFVMLMVVLFNLLLQKNVSDINKSINSIYTDRLIPATDIFYLSKNLHNRQLAMATFLYRDGGDIDKLERTLSKYTDNMFELITKYEKTYLVDEESIFLKRFKENITSYIALEKRIITLSKADEKAIALNLYETEGQSSLDATIGQLSDLTTIQSAVGTKLLNDTKGIVSTSNFLSSLQLILAIVIGLMILVLIFSSKIINRPQENFKWN